MNQASNKTLTISEFFQGIRIVAEGIKESITTFKKNLEAFTSALEQEVQRVVPIVIAFYQAVPRFIVTQYSPGLIADHEHLSLEKRTIQGWDFTYWRELKVAVFDKNFVCFVTPSTFTLVKYSDLGLCDKRNGKINIEGKLFMKIAQKKPLSRKDPKKSLTDRQRKYRLDQKLQKFFDMSEPAFELYPWTNQYETKFPLKYIKK